MAKPQTTSVVMDDPADRTGRLKARGGSTSDAFNNSALTTLWLKNAGLAERERQVSAMVVALIGIAPRDALEGMLAGQLVAAGS